MKFTKEQLAAIDHAKGNLQILACAGSGKTEVVARRISKLIADKKATPKNIIAFTYTEKAAGELKDRIHTRCREADSTVVGMAEMYVGTIHGFCLELLHREVPEFLKYGVLDEVQQKLFIDRYCNLSGLTNSTDLAGNPLRRYVDTNIYTSALGILRETDTDPALMKGVSVADNLKTYEQLLKKRRYLDYSSILAEAVDVLGKDAELQNRLRERVCYVIVDEYQDLNPIQEKIVRQLHDLGADICIVGDDDQTIYQWRGSDVGNILKFATRYPTVKQIPLEKNFRSSEGVVNTARKFIEQNAARLPKEMQSAGNQTYEPGDITALVFNDPAEEAAHIVRKIKSLVGAAFNEDNEKRGLSYSDFAVLLRSVSKSGAPIMEALHAAGIPFLVVGMNGLFDTAEAQAARAMFYYLASHETVMPDTQPRQKNPPLTLNDVQRAWEHANLGIRPGELKTALAQLDVIKRALESGEEQRFSAYSLQRVYLAFLEDIAIREESVPGTSAGEPRGEMVFYNLGKFSQLISDFEEIHYQSDPMEKFKGFGGFLEFGAAEAYPEGWQTNQYANPDAVKIMTVHQAKGMQWPVVFLPALVKNRFPSKKHGGRTVWHLIPAAAVPNQTRYLGNIEDERRLFYVAMTRAQKFLFITTAPVLGNRLYQKESEFLDDVRASKYVLRRDVDLSHRPRLPRQAKANVANVIFSFSDLKYFFECPYQFKLRVLYGFNAPIHEALGFGKSLHDALAEMHARALDGRMPDAGDVDELVERHLHVPYAYPKLRDNLKGSAKSVLQEYIKKNRQNFKRLEFFEKDIQINLGGGISVVGRIDLVRRTDTNEVKIVDFKTSERCQEEAVTETQLHVYALGYIELTGHRADYVEIYELEDQHQKTRSVDDLFVEGVKTQVKAAAKILRLGDLKAIPSKKKCSDCDLGKLCSERII
ncbi:ATP-dependent DNA helicase PcrA [mine drainage metagenome]|uniref:DNA 3'-5' helicase n=1 Tax=mine drainage metagenome TaxID=410659 RepID=A0A1J5QU46_9ZZZZ